MKYATTPLHGLGRTDRAICVLSRAQSSSLEPDPGWPAGVGIPPIDLTFAAAW